jgi:hypothetical protein
MIYSGAMDNTLRIWNVKGDNRHLNDDSQGWVSCITNIRKGKECFFAVGKY